MYGTRHWPVRFRTAAAAVGLLLTVCGCAQDGGGGGGGGGNGGGTDNGTTGVEERAILPDTVEITLADDGRMTLRGTGVPEQVHPGALLVSTRDGGYLRRVRAVEGSGAALTLATEPAALTDVMPTGTLNLSVAFDPDQVVVEVPEDISPAQRQRMRFAKTADGRSAFTTRDHTLELEGYGKVTLDELTVEFSPDFEVSLETENRRVKTFLCQATTTFDLSLDVSVEAAAITENFSKDTTIWRVSWPNPVGIMTIGGVPVVYQCFLLIKLGAEVSFGELGTTSAGFDFSTQATLGARYDADGWQPITELTPSFAPHAPQWGITPITAQVYVQPEFGIKFYQVVGPSLSWKEYVELAGDYRYAQIGAEIARGSECDLNIRFQVIDGLPSFAYQHNLFASRQVLLARMLSTVDPPGLGDAAISPADLGFGFYPCTRSLTLSADPAPGYEAAGWTVRNLLDSGTQVKRGATLADEAVDGSKLFVAGFVPEGAGDSWSGAGTGTGAAVYTVTTEVFPPEAGRIILFPGGDAYQRNVNVLVAAQPEEGFEFHHWELNLSGDQPTQSLEITGNKSIRAVFASNPPRDLRVPSDHPSLQDALDAATYNDVIVLEAGTHRGEGYQDITITRDHLVIRGAGASQTIIDLEGEAQLGWLDDVKIAFEDLQVYGGSSNLGGAVRLTGDTEASFRNCTFRSCTAGSGGAIYASGGGTKLRWENCQFESNQATGSGGGLSLGASPPDEAHVPVVSGCLFADNVADSSGGGIAAGGLCRVTECTFTGNSADRGGGGSFDDGVVVTDCLFQDNTARQGGGIHAAEFTQISGCGLSGNMASDSGGGIHADDGVTIAFCTLAENQAGEDGGGIYADRVSAGKTLTVHHCSISDNSAGVDGGGIRCDGTEVASCDLTGNTAGQRGGGLRASHSAIVSCSLVGNRAGLAGTASASEGGGVFLAQSSLTNCQVTSNEAVAGSGGGIFAEGSLSDVAIAPRIVGAYVAYNQAESGGGLASDLEVQVLSSTFADNTAAYRGGGVFAERGAALSLCWIERNTAETGGGASLSGSSVTASTVTQNEASRSGGGLSLFESQASGCTVSGNTATSEGGGIWTGVGCLVENSNITGNGVSAADGSGGGIACHGAPELVNVTVSGNAPTNCNSDCDGC